MSPVLGAPTHPCALTAPVLTPILVHGVNDAFLVTGDSVPSQISLGIMKSKQEGFIESHNQTTDRSGVGLGLGWPWASMLSRICVSAPLCSSRGVGSILFCHSGFAGQNGEWRERTVFLTNFSFPSWDNRSIPRLVALVRGMMQVDP